MGAICIYIPSGYCRGQGDHAPLLRILRTLVIVTLACHCEACVGGLDKDERRCDFGGEVVSYMRLQQRRLQPALLILKIEVEVDTDRLRLMMF